VPDKGKETKTNETRVLKQLSGNLKRKNSKWQYGVSPLQGGGENRREKDREATGGKLALLTPKKGKKKNKPKGPAFLGKEKRSGKTQKKEGKQ